MIIGLTIIIIIGMACRIYIIIPAHAQKSIIILILHLSVSDVSDVSPGRAFDPS